MCISREVSRKTCFNTCSGSRVFFAVFRPRKSHLIPITFLLAAVFLPVGRGYGAADFTVQREAMVRDQIVDRGVKDPGVLRAMKEVPRHLFIPESRRSESYDDHPVPIGLGQTISQPYIVALMTELLELKDSDRVFELGTGSGYQAAVASRIARDVFTTEIYDELARSAAGRLERLGYQNVTVRSGDGYFGWRDKAPFDAIIVTAAVDHIPPPLLDQLKAGGRMIIPLGSPFFVQQLVLVTKDSGGGLEERPIIPVRFVPLQGH